MEPNSPSVSYQGSTSQSFLTPPSQLLKSSWSFFKIHWKILVYIVALPTAIMYVGQILSLSRASGLMVIGGLLSLVAIILTVTMQAAAILAIGKLANDPAAKLSVKEQYREGFKYFWSLVLLIIMQAIFLLGSSVLLVIPGIIVAVYIGMNIFARVIDQKKGFEAFTESYSLVKGRWWAVLGRVLFLGVVYIVVAIIFGLVSTGVQAILGVASHSDTAIIISIIFNFVLGAILGPVSVIYIYKMYMSLKETRMADVSRESFKKWLVAFMIIGILALIVLPILLGVVIFSFIRSVVENGNILTATSSVWTLK